MSINVNRLICRGWVLPLLLALVACPITGMPARAAEGADDILQTSKRLAAEEQRQLDVRRRLGTVTRRIDWLLNELAANQLQQKGRSDVVGKVNAALISLNETRVPKAVEALARARANPKAALPHLQAADKEIEVIYAELTRLMKDLGGSLDEEMLLKKLRELIESEDFIRRQTAAWGRKLFLEPDSADIDKSRLAQVQGVLGDRYNDFEALLIKTHGNTSDADSKRRLGLAKDSVAQSLPGVLMRNAVSQINAKAALDAVRSQDQVLAALHAVEKILTEGLAPDAARKDLAEELKRVLKDQQALRAQTEKKDQVKNNASELAARQMEIKNDLAAVSADNPLSAAQQAMQSAVNQINAGDQTKAMQSQDSAIAALDAAIQEAQKTSPTLGNAAPGDPKPGVPMPGGAPMDVPGSQPLAGGMPMDGPPGPPMPGDMKGIPLPATMSPPEDMEISAGGESLTEVKGDGVKRTGSTLTALQQQARAAAIQKYVQQIPPEFRKEVAEYYEVLAQ